MSELKKKERRERRRENITERAFKFQSRTLIFVGLSQVAQALGAFMRPLYMKT